MTDSCNHLYLLDFIILSSFVCYQTLNIYPLDYKKSVLFAEF